MADDLEDIDLNDPQLDEYERMIAEMSDEDNPGASKKKAAAPKPAPAPAKKKQAPAPSKGKKPEHHDDSDDPLDESYLDLERQLQALEEESAGTPKKTGVTTHQLAEPEPEEEGGNKDKNGVSEEKLMEEEDKYHTKESIMSLEALNHEISNYINPILEGNLVGEDYRDIISANKDEWELYIEKTTRLIQSEKLTLEKYLELIRGGLSNEESLLKIAKAKKASITTVDRITARIKVIQNEIKQYTDPDGAEEAPAQGDPKPAESQPVAPANAVDALGNRSRREAEEEVPGTRGAPRRAEQDAEPIHLLDPVLDREPDGDGPRRRREGAPSQEALHRPLHNHPGQLQASHGRAAAGHAADAAGHQPGRATGEVGRDPERSRGVF